MTAWHRALLAVATCLWLGPPMPAAASDAVSELVELTLELHTRARAAQREIDELSGDTRDAEAKRRRQQQEEALRAVERERLENLTSSQALTLASLYDQLGNAGRLEAELVPIMARMIDTLERVVSRDLAFHTRARQARVATLRDSMSRADLSLADKLQRILDAYQREVDYGYAVESYRTRGGWAGSERVVDALRVGRLGLYAITLDGRDAAIWDVGTSGWRRLPDAERALVRRALRDLRGNGETVLTVPLPLGPDDR